MGLINKHEIWLMVYWIEKWEGICIEHFLYVLIYKLNVYNFCRVDVFLFQVWKIPTTICFSKYLNII